MIYRLKLNDRAFHAIIQQTKRIEIRANTKEEDFTKLTIGDQIIFVNSQNQTIRCDVTEVNHYNSAEELLMLEGTRYTTSSTNDYHEAVKSIYNIPGYKQAIQQSGVYAIHLHYPGEE